MTRSCHRTPSVVILAKDTTAAKTRLQLPRDQTRQLATRLADSTVRTVLSAATVGAVLVVTGDREIGLNALDAGANVVAEPRPLGMNNAAGLGRRHALVTRPKAPVAVMVADLPHLCPDDVDTTNREFLDSKQPLYVADLGGSGTTFLIHGPDRHLGFGFGTSSAEMHRRLGYREALTAPRGLRTDLDSREDLARLGVGIWEDALPLPSRPPHAHPGPAPVVAAVW